MKVIKLRFKTAFALALALTVAMSCSSKKDVAGQTAETKNVKVQLSAVGFYNLENLFDTIDNENNDAEYLPNGANKWGSMKYNAKLKNMSYVISQMAIDNTPAGIALLGVSEIENRGVLEDLVKQPALKDRSLQIVHYDSPFAVS